MNKEPITVHAIINGEKLKRKRQFRGKTQLIQMKL